MSFVRCSFTSSPLFARFKGEEEDVEVRRESTRAERKLASFANNIAFGEDDKIDEDDLSSSSRGDGKRDEAKNDSTDSNLCSNDEIPFSMSSSIASSSYFFSSAEERERCASNERHNSVLGFQESSELGENCTYKREEEERKLH